MTESAGLLAITLICGLFADSLLTRHKLRDLTERVRDLERAARDQ